ncbi:MAG: hypothetical protein ACRDV4_04390 [Acidimicrobiales bacterium]
MANETVICTYRVRPGEETRFEGLLGGHWQLLHELGFVTDETSAVFKGVDDLGTYVEVFTWVDGGFDRAHEHPDVLDAWERMDPLLEQRDGRPKWEFPHFERLALGA